MRRTWDGVAAAILITMAARSSLADDVTDIVINEVMYNPASGDNQEDWLELYNQSPTQSYNLQGFHFTSGIVFTFPSVSLGPNGYLVVCANQNRIRQLEGN